MVVRDAVNVVSRSVRGPKKEEAVGAFKGILGGLKGDLVGFEELHLKNPWYTLKRKWNPLKLNETHWDPLKLPLETFLTLCLDSMKRPWRNWLKSPGNAMNVPKTPWNALNRPPKELRYIWSSHVSLWNLLKCLLKPPETRRVVLSPQNAEAFSKPLKRSEMPEILLF